jgi:3-methyl-2-oxobutanoate hydroxymethyltransferase
MADPPSKPFTFNDLRAARTSGERVAMLTCYDYTTARLLDEAGVPMLLVGDSAASVILGHPSTLPASLDFMIECTAAVKRGAARALVMGDMPFGSYHESDAQGVRNAVAMVQRSQCDCIKIEASASSASLISRLADAGVAVIAHLGLRPQAVGLMGGYKFQGRTAAEARAIVGLSRTLVQAGAAALLLEAVPNEVSQAVVDAVDVPVIGCGAGPACHAHVVVLQDLLAQTPRQPKFVPKIDLSASLIENARAYVNLIRRGAYPAAEHGYEMPASERGLFAVPSP